MKKGIHSENYREVIFLDTSSGEKFLLFSTIESEETDKWEDGKEYPLVRVEISSASHPFYTGKETVVDTAGRVEKFKARRAAAEKKKSSTKAKKTEKKAPKKEAKSEKKETKPKAEESSDKKTDKKEKEDNKKEKKEEKQ